ncbi:MAG: amidohydrolase family protein [Smithellaceae bacterium]|nr:amidohydrolase family protein [Smithellaceae bacterium]
MNSLPDRIVDFHVHLFPDRLCDAIWKQFIADYGWDVIHHLYCRESIEYLREHGVGAIVYSNYAHREGVAEGLNEWNLQTLREFPDLYCFAAYHPGDKNALTMAARILDNPCVLGFKLQLLVQRFYPHDERLFPLYELVMEKGKRLLFHVGTGPVGNEFVGFEHFVKLLERYPELPATVAHMGALEYREFASLLDDHPRLYMDTSFSFLPQLGAMFNLGSDFLERYQDRILYGSDFPNILFPREAEIDYLLSLGLPQPCLDKIFSENGLRLISEITDQIRP